MKGSKQFGRKIALIAVLTILVLGYGLKTYNINIAISPVPNFGVEHVYAQNIETSEILAAEPLSSVSPESTVAMPVAVFNEDLTAFEANNSSLAVKVESSKVDQNKVNSVRNYLASRGSPLADYAEYIVKTADEVGIDYRLVAAISIIESSGGIYCYRPYNAWGWGGANGYSFSSWEESISVVSRGLGAYYARGAVTPWQIAPAYNPHTPQEWATKVTSVMSQM